MPLLHDEPLATSSSNDVSLFSRRDAHAQSVSTSSADPVTQSTGDSTPAEADDSIGICINFS